MADELAVAFRERLATGVLHIQRCAACGRWRHIPRVLCAACGSELWTWEPVAGTGQLFSWTTTQRALHPDFTDVPYTVAVVELDEGPRVLAPLVDLDGTPPAIGLRLEFVPAAAGTAPAVPTFRPAPVSPPVH